MPCLKESFERKFHHFVLAEKETYSRLGSPSSASSPPITGIEIDVSLWVRSFPPPLEATFRDKVNSFGDFAAVKVAEADYADLGVCACMRPRVILVQQWLSCSRAPGAAPQANPGQTLRDAVTFKNNLPPSRKIDNIFVTPPPLLSHALPLRTEQLSLNSEKMKMHMCRTNRFISALLSLIYLCCWKFCACRHEIEHRIKFSQPFRSCNRTIKGPVLCLF